MSNRKIISASYKEDLPAFRSEEFFKDLSNGFTLVPTKAGPMKVSLRPEDVYAYEFWTKNPSDHFMANVHTIDNICIMQWTITGYGKDIETEVPEKAEVIRRFKKLSQILLPSCMNWRYDPILISDKYSVEWHKAVFEMMCRQLRGYTKRCVISFMDEYGKIRDAVQAGIMRAPTTAEIHELAEFMGRTAPAYGITVQTCSEGKYDLRRYGIHEAPCIDAAQIEAMLGETLPDAVKTPNSFRRCYCAVNTDIGQYHICKHGCKYCYAK